MVWLGEDMGRSSTQRTQHGEDVDASGLDVVLGVAITMVGADAVTIATSWRGRGGG